MEYIAKDSASLNNYQQNQILSYPNSVSPKHPTSSRLSMPFSNLAWCRSVPSFNTVPPNRLNCTVILVDIAGSTMLASSWAANIFKGLFLKSKTEMKPLSQIFCNLSNAT